MRGDLTVRRALLPLAVPYLGMACLALLALASGHALSAELGYGAHPSVSSAFSAAWLVTSVEKRPATASAPLASSHASGAQSAARALSAPRVASIRAPQQPLAWGGQASAAGSPTAGLLIAVVLARGH